MRYMCLIFTDECAAAQWTPGQMHEMIDKHIAFGNEARQAGVYVAADPLEATSTATVVRVRDGKTFTTDGPFAETKEQLAGYYIFECGNLDEALDWAARIPTAAQGSIEVRPIKRIPGL